MVESTWNCCLTFKLNSVKSRLIDIKYYSTKKCCYENWFTFNLKKAFVEHQTGKGSNSLEKII